MRIFFIYDTTFCKTDEDDPKDAILYIFPTQLYENQYYSLCGQIVGIAKFLQTTFSSPSCIVLDHGKFALHWSGKYLLVLGESSDIHKNILKRHLLFLCGIFCFYHGSLSNLLKVYKNDRRLFLVKMELAWSRYITFTECFTNLLQVSVNSVPITFFKKHTDAISKAKQLLHLCQMSASVVAGAVFCNGRILSSQLPPELTSFLTLLSNANASAPVDSVKIPLKDLPPDVELKYIYLNDKVIQSILKYNHSLVGTAVRLKMNNKSQKQQVDHKSSDFQKIVNSGSEGDVDSGNCTENIRFKKSKLNGKKERGEWNKLDFRSLLLCCSMHAAMFRKDLLNCQNVSFLEYLNSEFISEKLKTFKERTSLNFKMSSKKKSTVHSIAKEKSDIAGTSCHLLCYFHASRISSNFHSKSIHRHMNLSSACDLEFSCYFCINHRFSTNLTSLSLKKWNSFMNIPDYLWYIPQKHGLSTLAVNKHKKRKTSKCKVQILKCRARCDTDPQYIQKSSFYSFGSKRICDWATQSDLQCESLKCNLYHTQGICNIEKYWQNVEKNDLEKSTVYVQRCGSNIILLLLNKSYDENVLTYLWNCGFTFLSDLDYGEKHIEEGNELDPVHYIMVYDSAEEALKESPHCHNSVFSEKHVKESIQAIHARFQSNPKFHLCALLCANESIFACQANQQSAFYLQKDLISRKVDSLCSLSKKAVRRFEKYFKFSL